LQEVLFLLQFLVLSDICTMKKETKSIVEGLVNRAQKGDTEAFGEVYDELLAPVYRYIYAKVPEEVAEDLTEDTFFKAWKNLRRYKKQPDCMFTSWIFRIAHNTVVDYYRKHEQFEELSIDLPDENILSKPTLGIELAYDGKILKHFIGKLSDSLQQAVILRFVNDLKYSEIAKIMKRTEGSVRVLIHRALQQLREMMQSEGYKK